MRVKAIHLKPEDLVEAEVPPMHFCGGATPTYAVRREPLLAASPGTTRLTPSEIESLRQETKRASAWAKQQLANQAHDNDC